MEKQFDTERKRYKALLSAKDDKLMMEMSEKKRQQNRVLSLEQKVHQIVREKKEYEAKALKRIKAGDAQFMALKDKHERKMGSFIELIGKYKKEMGLFNQYLIEWQNKENEMKTQINEKDAEINEKDAKIESLEEDLQDSFDKNAEIVNDYALYIKLKGDKYVGAPLFGLQMEDINSLGMIQFTENENGENENEDNEHQMLRNTSVKKKRKLKENEDEENGENEDNEDEMKIGMRTMLIQI